MKIADATSDALCTPCEVGHYAPSAGASACASCPRALCQKSVDTCDAVYGKATAFEALA